MLIIGLLTGLILGAAAAWLVLRPAARERDEYRLELASVKAELEVERRSFDEKVSTTIKALSAEALKENNESFLALAETKLQGYIGPLKESLAKVEVHVGALEQARQKSYGALSEQVTRLSDTTGRLATALRAPNVRGQWGQIQLRRVVELAGMLPYCDFQEQVTADSDDGLVRPDLIVRLPGGKQVVIDAKVPGEKYFDAVNTRDDEERRALLTQHARQVRDHMNKLSSKSYWQQFSSTPDFVVMFLPDESFFRAAWEHDPGLVETGVRSRVHVASPTTLIVLLQAIAYGWQQETAAEDARNVHRLGRELYDRLTRVGDLFAKLGRSLDSAVDSYNETVGSLETRVLPTARKLDAYVLTDKRLPELEPIDVHSRALQAPELAAGDDAPLALDEA